MELRHETLIALSAVENSAGTTMSTCEKLAAFLSLLNLPTYQLQPKWFAKLRLRNQISDISTQFFF